MFKLEIFAHLVRIGVGYYQFIAASFSGVLLLVNGIRFTQSYLGAYLLTLCLG